MRGSPLRAVRIQACRGPLHYSLAPPALRHEHFILGIHELFLNETTPVAQPHGVILPDSEALLLTRANYIAHQISQQPPVVQLALPRLHGVVVRAAIKTQ